MFSAIRKIRQLVLNKNTSKVLECSYLPHTLPRVRVASYSIAFSQSKSVYSTTSTDSIKVDGLFAPLLTRATTFGDRTAILDTDGAYTYRDLLRDSAGLSNTIIDNVHAPLEQTKEPTVAFLTPRDYSYTAALYGTWLSGAIAVPLCTSHPGEELEYVLRDSKAEAVLAHPDYTDILVPIASRLEIPLIPLANHINQWRDGGHKADATVQTTRPAAKNALIVYTSGTTGKPKGVLLSHGNVDHQIRGLVEAWHWQPTDHLLHVLPLHHVHGIVVALLGALYSGAICEFHPVFCETSVLSRLSGMAPAHFGKRRSGLQMGYLSHNDEKSENVSKQTKISSPNMFMAVPTIYAKLLQRHRALLANEADVSAELHDKLKQNLRLMTSGSAPLPISVMDEWRRVSGHTLLERYGMTETGICISNSYEGERVPAAVGKPMLGVEARIANVDNLEVVQDIADGESGILLIRGAGVFREYWGNVRATAESFVDGQWFVTGDEAVREPNGVIRILGRASSDILKTGGYKVSALEVENVLLEHPEVNECVVYGTPDEVWGDRITAMVVQHNPKPELMIEDLRTFAKCRLADYKLPSRLVLKETIPRNAMGKVNKKALVKDKANW